MVGAIQAGGAAVLPGPEINFAELDDGGGLDGVVADTVDDSGDAALVGRHDVALTLTRVSYGCVIVIAAADPVSIDDGVYRRIVQLTRV